MLIVIQERKKFSFSFFKKKEVALFIFSGSPNLDKILNETSRLICFENIVELRLGYFGPMLKIKFIFERSLDAEKTLSIEIFSFTN